MISHEKKFIFIHIPKTAGCTLKKIMEPYSPNKLVVADGALGPDTALHMLEEDSNVNVFHPSVAYYEKKYGKDDQTN